MTPDNLTFLIIAQNEEKLLAAAIASCRGLGKVLVVDGGSADRTIAIAEAAGAQVLRNPFRYSAQQYNFGLEHVTTTWTFILDSDERLGQELSAALSEITPAPDVSAYWVTRRNYFVGNPINHSNWSPDANMRLLRTSSARYEDRPVHARVRLLTGRAAWLRGRLHHLTYLSIEQYVSKLNRLTSREVEARPLRSEALDSRSAARMVYLRLPFKPLIRWFYMYVIRLGVLDGRRGFVLAVLSGFYEFVVSAKQELPPTAAVEREIYE